MTKIGSISASPFNTDASMDKPKAGFLGILNGLIGIDKSNSGPIAARFDENEGISFVLRDSSN